MKLQIGCGNDKRKGYINLDGSKEVKPDVVWNLEKTPLPFKSNQFEEILVNHVLESAERAFKPLSELFNYVPKDKIIINTYDVSDYGFAATTRRSQ